MITARVLALFMMASGVDPPDDIDDTHLVETIVACAEDEWEQEGVARFDVLPDDDDPDRRVTVEILDGGHAVGINAVGDDGPISLWNIPMMCLVLVGGLPEWPMQFIGITDSFDGPVQVDTGDYTWTWMASVLDDGRSLLRIVVADDEVS